MRFRKTFLFLLAPAALLGAQPILNFPVPLAPAPPPSSPAGDELSREAAARAQELGFPTVAAGLYRSLLASPGADRTSLGLALVTALLDDGRVDEAEQALAEIPVHASAWHLRAGLIAAQKKKIDLAKAELAAVKPDLSPADRPWYYFLQGILAAAAGDPVRAGSFYQQAEREAPTDLARARFLLAHEELRLRVGQVSEDMTDQMRQNAERFAGTATGYDFARSYAVMLDALGRKNAAVDALQRDLLGLPPQQRARADDFRLLMGMIAGAADGPGRNALIQLVETGSDTDRQRVALQLLARALAAEPGRSFFRSELDKWIGAATPHPILDDLLFMRADLALGDKVPEYQKAEDSAHALLDKYPGSPLKPHALGVLVRSAWEQRRYRAAAEFARLTRDALSAGEDRSKLGVVGAEAWFRAGDFGNAADAYAAVLRDPPSGIPVGELMFQRIEALIRAGNLKEVEAALDDLARSPAFDAVNRWEAEWNLARALQADGQTAEAYARVNRLLASQSAAGLPPELRIRMAWLQARLSFDAHEPERTLKLVDVLGGLLDGTAPEFRTQIASTGALLKAQAYFELKREAEGLDALRKLRANFPRADAAVSSFFIEAEHYAQQDKVVEAQQLLTRLADDFPKSTYAPYALYQAAYLAERLGADKNLEDADRLIERLVTSYPESDLVFDARLKQGDLLRKLNRFALAQQVYESLINNYGRSPDVILARLALAECHNAQSASDPSHEERARALFEDLCARVDAPVDVRVEAGFNLGSIYRRRGNTGKAEEAWWRDVVTAFLLDPKNAAKLGDKGRYWMARTLLDLGSAFQQEGKFDQAADAWRCILKAKLPGETLARSNLATLNPAPAKP